MKQTVKLFSLILAVAMLLSACAPAVTPAADPQATTSTAAPVVPQPSTPPAAEPTSAPATPQQIQVTEADQGKNIMLNPGDSLVITLVSNPSTGYAWEVKPVDHAVLALIGEPAFKADSDSLGAPGKTTLNFQTAASGSQALTLLYRRSFEKNAQPLKTFTINVTVSGPATATTSSASIPNPASENCVKQGYKSEVRTAADRSQYGVCKFPDGSECEEWAYFRGNCKAR